MTRRDPAGRSPDRLKNAARLARAIEPVEKLESRQLLSTVKTAEHGGLCGCGTCAGLRDTAAARTASITLNRLQTDSVSSRISLVDAFRPVTQLVPTRPDAVSYIRPNRLSPFAVDLESLADTLEHAPMEFTGQRPLQVAIPSPDGSMKRFAIVESPVMAPELQAKFPQIRTFAGAGLDDPTATIRFDYTPQGFHAQVLAADGSWYVDPYFHLDTAVHVAYFRRDLPMREDQLNWTCGVGSRAITDRPPEVGFADAEPAATDRSGTELRTLRLAVAATGEYTQFHGGTVTLAQAAIVTAVNRVSGIYERDVAVRMVLVPNNTSVVFTNPNTDPYTNHDLPQMLGQNQITLDNRIGSANYDIGHVFGTGGGGIAGLGSAGINGFKAYGVTALQAPIGDAFYIDYVAHEMGHQYGADHTFNTGAVGQRVGSVAFEIGSGSTIMSYAGITGVASDVQNNSDDVFHAASFDQILFHLNNSIPGVGTRTPTGNTVPTVNGGPDYVIPANTPFELTATAFDANGDFLTYSWEQRDLGDAEDLTQPDDGNGPLFRAYAPTSSPTRSFPRLASVLSGANQTFSVNGSPYVVERLPTVSRSAMNFRVTVRDNRFGGGGVNTDNVTLAVVNTGAAFALTSLNSFTTLSGGTSVPITWNVAGTSGGTINAQNVDIFLSTDGGNTFPITLASATPNDGSHSIVVPTDVVTGNARIKIRGTGNVFFDINNSSLSIVQTQSALPGTPALAAASDTGLSSSDGVTRRNNASVASQLQFVVPATVPGAIVEILADGVVIGTATATTTTTTVTTTGTQPLADGVRSITARQTEPGKTPRLSSPASITIDATSPTATINPLPTQRTSSVGTITFGTSETVYDLSLSAFSLTRDGGANLLGGTLNATTGTSFSVSGLASLTDPRGSYAFAHNGASGTDLAGNPIAAFSTTWRRLLLGDMNDDGQINNQDIAFFVQALTNVAAYEQNTGLQANVVGDIDGNGTLNNQDISPFVALLTGGRPAATASPTPPTTKQVDRRGSTSLSSRPGLFSTTPLADSIVRGDRSDRIAILA